MEGLKGHSYSQVSMVSNYRPISLLFLVGKAQERLVHEALMSHVLNVGAISDNQYGFRPGSSTQEALLTLTRKSSTEGGVYLDLAKAFDSIPHSLIMESQCQGSWFHRYLSNLLLQRACPPQLQMSPQVSHRGQFRDHSSF